MFSFLRIIIVAMLGMIPNIYADNVFDSIEDTNAKLDSSKEDIFSFIDRDSVTFLEKAKIVIMNKITANSKEFELPVGSKAKYGHAELIIHKCAKSDDPAIGSMILVTLKDTGEKEDIKTLFSGWVFSKSPSISAVEHPVYQLLAISCS